MGLVQHRDPPVITLHAQGIHPGGHLTWTQLVQWQPQCSDTVGMLGGWVVWLFHPSPAKVAVAPPHRSQRPEKATRILRACVVAPPMASRKGLAPMPIPIPLRSHCLYPF